MKILKICSVPVTFPGGSEKVILELSKKMSKKNQVTILQTNLYEEGKKIKKTSKIGRIKVITCKNDFFLGGYGYSKEFKRILKRIWEEYDIIHIYGHGRFTTNFSLNFLKNKKPILFSPHGFFHDKKHKKFKKLHDVIFRGLLKKAKPHCIALTEIEKRRFMDFGVPEKNISILPGGIELKKVKKFNLSQLRTKYLKKNKGKKIMLYVGRVHESKGNQYVIKAIKDLDIHFLIAGKDAGYSDFLKELAKKEGIANKVTLLGMVSDSELEELYALTDFFILFSSWEGFGLVVIEAMNAEKPVIVSDRGSLPLLVKDNQTGFIVKYEDVGELTKKIKLLSEDDKFRKEMGKNAKQFSKKFSWEQLTQDHLKIYGAMKNDK